MSSYQSHEILWAVSELVRLRIFSRVRVRFLLEHHAHDCIDGFGAVHKCPVHHNMIWTLDEMLDTMVKSHKVRQLEQGPPACSMETDAERGKMPGHTGISYKGMEVLTRYQNFQIWQFSNLVIFPAISYGIFLI